MNTSITDTMPWGKFGGKCSIMMLPQWYIDWFLSTVKQEQHRSLYGAVNYVNDTRKARNKQRGENMAKHNIVWKRPTKIAVAGNAVDYREQRFGDLTAQYPCERAEKRTKNGAKYTVIKWFLVCDCGTYIKVPASTLAKGGIYCCGKCKPQSRAYAIVVLDDYKYDDKNTQTDLVEEQEEKGKLSKNQPSASADMDVSVPEPATCRVDIDEIIEAQEWAAAVADPGAVNVNPAGKSDEELVALVRQAQDFKRAQSLLKLTKWLDGLCS